MATETPIAKKLKPEDPEDVLKERFGYFFNEDGRLRQVVECDQI